MVKQAQEKRCKNQTYPYSLKDNKRRRIFVETSGRPLEAYELDSVGAQKLQQEFGLSESSPRIQQKGLRDLQKGID